MLRIIISWRSACTYFLAVTGMACSQQPAHSPCGPVAVQASEPSALEHEHSEHGHAHQAAVAIVEHQHIKNFAMNGNALQGVATKGQGATQYEVWRTSVAVGSQTPAHTHDSEEVFIFLSGKGKAMIGEKTFEFKAPATVIAPAGVQHQFFNTGELPTDAIVIIGIDSKIYDAQGKLMSLPWRQ